MALNKFNLQLFAAVTTRSIDRERRDLDVSKKIARYHPDATPFAVILMRARKEPTMSNYFYWYDSDLPEWWAHVDANDDISDSTTLIPVNDASIFRAKDVWKVPATDEVLFVEEVINTPGTKQIKVVRGYGTTTPAIIPKDADLMRMGNAMEEFSRAPESRIHQPTKGENYTQIFRTPFDQSMTSNMEHLKTSETERNRLRRDKAIEHRLDMERAFIFGEPKQDPNVARQTTAGVLHFIKDQKFTSNVAFNEDVFENFCEFLFSKGSDKKLLICSHTVGAEINKFAANRIETRSGEETYGLRLKQYKSFHGDLFIVPSKTFERKYGGLVLGLDIQNIYYRPLRDTKLRANIHNNDEDGWRDEYLTEAGIQVRLPKTHAWMHLDLTDWKAK